MKATRAIRALRALSTLLLGTIMVLGALPVAHGAQLYRWVDSKGNVEWRDTPPPASVPAKNIQERRVGANVVSAGDGSFAMQQAAKNHPITFWSSKDCGKGCDTARAYLARRGVPFSELTPPDDVDAFKAVSPKLEVPVLVVGRQKATGYLESEWNSLLEAAGYPATATGGVKSPALSTPPAGVAGPAPQGGPPSPGTAAPVPEQPPAGAPAQPR